jgi:predicted deacylase
MTTIAPLSASYREARAAFLAAATAAGARVTTTVHPLLGVEGEELAVDIAELGPADAEHVVIVVSGTHGVEGYAGSALQRHWLHECTEERPENVCVIAIHGLNPFGFSWMRRVNEDNVDLNRNFVDWTAAVPTSDGYDQIADILVPDRWDESEQTRTMTALLNRVSEIGMQRMQADVSGGQYQHPKGVFYGGTGPVWSHLWLREFCTQRLPAARRVAVIDLHTGLGPWAHGELIGSEAADSSSHSRAKQWWGEVTSMSDGNSVSAQLTGDWMAIADELAPGAEVTAVTIEYGTVDGITTLQALRADAWLHGYGDPRGGDALAIRTALRGAFADDDPAWIAALWPRFHEVITKAFEQLR